MSVCSLQVIMWELMHATTAYMTHQHMSFGGDADLVAAAAHAAADGPAPQLDWHPDFPLMPARVPLSYTQLANACLQRNAEMRPSSAQLMQALANVQRAVQRNPAQNASALMTQVWDCAQLLLYREPRQACIAGSP
jgi:hypothetical protein